MADKPTCSKCGEIFYAKYHFLDRCEKLELIRARKEIKILKDSVLSWKDAWFHLREIIGNLWWHHPAIDSDVSRDYYQAASQRVKEINSKVVFYSGFVGKEEHWHYKSWNSQGQK